MATSVQDSKIAKKSLRKQMKAKVATISQQEKKLQSKIVTGKVLNSAEYVNSKSIALYLHMDDEIQTEDILIQAFKSKMNSSKGGSYKACSCAQKSLFSEPLAPKGSS